MISAFGVLEPVEDLVHRWDTPREDLRGDVGDYLTDGFAAPTVSILSLALGQDQPPNVHVARLDQAELDHSYTDAAVDFCDRLAPIVESSDRVDDTRVVARGQRNQDPIVARAPTGE